MQSERNQSNRFEARFDADSTEKAVYGCSLCRFRTHNKWYLKNHFNSIHLDLRPYKCLFCDYRSKAKQTLKSHMNRHIGLKPYKCSFPGCDYRCVQSGRMKIHEANHSKTTRPSCPVCKAHLESIGQLAEHVDQVHPSFDLNSIRKSTQKLPRPDLLFCEDTTTSSKVQPSNWAPNAINQFPEITLITNELAAKKHNVHRASLRLKAAIHETVGKLVYDLSQRERTLATSLDANMAFQFNTALCDQMTYEAMCRSIYSSGQAASYILENDQHQMDMRLAQKRLDLMREESKISEMLKCRIYQLEFRRGNFGRLMRKLRRLGSVSLTRPIDRNDSNAQISGPKE